jgi:sugar lactone lactonase YvrE
MKIAFVSVLAAGLLAASPAYAEDRLTPVFSSDLIVNGVATTRTGRTFLPVQPRAGKGDPQVVELREGQPVAYPDATWNEWKPGEDGANRFVGVNALRIGPDGALWIVDRGSPGIGKPAVPGGVKLVRIDITTNTVTRIYDLAGLTTAISFVDDVRFNGVNAYLTDAGQPGLIVLDLATGTGRRVLDGHPSTVAQTKLIAEGRELTDPSGKPVVIHADQLEVSPDGRWFYYQPSNGRMARIETRWLDDATLSASALASHVERFTDTPSTGGTAIADDGTIYLSDTDKKRILAIDPAGRITTLIADPRLIWVDAMWIDDKGNLLLPASQLNRTAGLNGGKNAVLPPVTLYRLGVDAKPAGNDHR